MQVGRSDGNFSSCRESLRRAVPSLNRWMLATASGRGHFMIFDNRPGHTRQPAGEIDLARASFHGLLLVRSKMSLTEYRRRKRLLRIADRWGSLAKLIGQGAIFAGGLAVGGGIMLLRRGEALRGRPGIVILVGGACMAIDLGPLLLEGDPQEGCVRTERLSRLDLDPRRKAEASIAGLADDRIRSRSWSPDRMTRGERVASCPRSA